MKTIPKIFQSSTCDFTMFFKIFVFAIGLMIISSVAYATMAQSGASDSPKNISDGGSENNVARNAFDRRYDLENQVKDKLFVLSLHRQNYFLPVTYNSHPNDETYEEYGKEKPNNYEAKFQLSFKMLIWENIFNSKGDLYAAYTQMSLWQIYNFSSPFRETNFEPELFLKFDTDFHLIGMHNRLFLIGFDHQSNGQDVPLSRSWNRIYIEFLATRGNFMLGVKPWYRIPEASKDDDNPDIDKYLGHGKIWGAYKAGKHVLSFTLRNNLRLDDNKGSIELGWSYELTHNLRAYLQYYNGYGESMIDYNNASNRIGIGVMINDWL